MKLYAHPKALTGALCACLMGSGCHSVPPVILACPPIPTSLTEPCRPADRELATNADLARAYLEAKGCLAEDRLKLAVIRELAGCRISRP